jgi:hypothetical protein
MRSGGKAVVVLSSVRGDDPLGEALLLLVQGCPQGAVEEITISASGDPVSLTQLWTKVSNAAQVVIQEPDSELRPEHISAVAAARACDVPLLLLSPAGQAVSRLARLADVAPSDVVTYPARRDDAPAWRALRAQLEQKSYELGDTCLRVDRVQYLEPITSHLSSAAATLDRASPDEETARLIARIFDEHNGSIRLENHVDMLQFDFPAGLYPELIAHLTSMFKTVRTIADPIAEELPWRDPVGSRSLSMVTERTFVLDEQHAKQFGLEGALSQLYLALQAGGQVSVAGLTSDLRAELVDGSPGNRRLKGLNRFYAGTNIVGGYADETGERIRMLAYRDADRINGPYARDLQVLTRVEEKKRDVPPEARTDPTTLASWIYSNAFVPPQLDSIYDYLKSAYADAYDANIVRVTPSYFHLLDRLAAEAQRALVTLYAPYSGRDMRDIRLLELGIGTGALTGRVIRMCGEFMAQMRAGPEHAERPFVEMDGWDANARMVQIASMRLASARQPNDGYLQPNLRVFKYEPDSYSTTSERYGLVLGSLIAHYWVDFLPDQHVARPSGLTRFCEFLTSLRDKLVAPGGLALFLDAFFDADHRDEERNAWANYVSRQLGSPQLADTYLKRNPWQFYAPSTDVVEAAATQLGFRVWWRQPLPELPFRVLVLASPNG